MASASSKPKKLKTKAAALAGSEQFIISQMTLTDHSYIDGESLRAFNTGLFSGTFKDNEDRKWTITIVPDTIRNLHIHKDAMTVFERVGLDRYFKLPAWGVDVKRAFQLLTTLQDDGKALIEDKNGQVLEVTITQDMVSEALKLPVGTQSLVVRGSSTEVKETFLLCPGQEYTFRDLLLKEVEFPLRLFTQQFQHRKAVRYTPPHRRVTRAFSVSLKKRALSSSSLEGCSCSELELLTTLHLVLFAGPLSFCAFVGVELASATEQILKKCLKLCAGGSSSIIPTAK